VTIRTRPQSVGTAPVRANAQRWQRLLEWAVILYTMSTVIEGALFSVGSARISRFVALLLIVVVAGYALATRIPRFLNLPLIGLIGVFALVALTAITSEYALQTFTRLGTYGLLVAVGTALASALAVLGAHGIVCVGRGLIAGAVTASLLIITARAQGNFIGAREYERLAGGRATAGLADPNDIALAMAIALPACFASKHWLARYVLAPTIVVSIFLTGSRGGLIALGAGGVAALIMLARANARPLQQAMRGLVIAALAGVVTWTFLPQVLVERFASLPREVTTGTMTRRTLYWEAAWEQFGENPFWGSGPGSALYFNYIRTGKSQIFHNTYLSFLVELGIVGWLFFLLALSAAWIGAVRLGKTWGWPVVSMAIMSVGIFGLSWDTKKLMWLLLITVGALLALQGRNPPFAANPPDPADALKRARRSPAAQKKR
jgi:hypothetical protein